MKPIAKRLLALASAAAISLSAVPAVQAVYREETPYDGVADWALLEVTAMDQLGLIPEELMDADMSEQITRREMCAIAVSTYEQVTGTTVNVPFFSPFSDTDDEYVEKAYRLGIVKGDGNRTFRPEDSLTRAEFFAFVGRYLQASGMMLTEQSYSDLAAFTDAATLPQWAWEPASLTVGLDIVRGSGTTLDWKRTTSYQEALAMFYRAYNASIDYRPAEAFEELDPSAEADVLRMDQLGLVPETVKEAPMTASMARSDLCSMVMRGYELLTDTTAEDFGEPVDVFEDTDDIDVLNAYALGLIDGSEDDRFEPEAPVTRQDFYTVACNFLEAVDYWYADEIIRDLSVYADSDEIAESAEQGTATMLAIGVATCDDEGKLEPTREITNQEAIVTFRRVIDFYADWTESYDAPDPYLGELVADLGLTKVGCRYVRGRQGPNKFDCSGLVYYVYKQFGYDLEPGARNQWSLLDKSVSKDDLLPGDLLFFSKNGRASGIFHVGIYIGDGQFVHAANSRKGVIVTDLDEAWYARRYLGAKRAIE